MRVQIACIVEGHGEVDAVPELVRRIAKQVDPAIIVEIPPPARIGRQKIVRTGELERAVELAARRIKRPGGIFILLDSDDDCPARLGPQLLARARAARGDIAISVVLATCEYEAWFLAAAKSLRGHIGLDGTLDVPESPEKIRAAKGWLRARMPRNAPYEPTRHQLELTRCFDLEAARQADSFDKCYREVEKLVRGFPQRF